MKIYTVIVGPKWDDVYYFTDFRLATQMLLDFTLNYLNSIPSDYPIMSEYTHHSGKFVETDPKWFYDRDFLQAYQNAKETSDTIDVTMSALRLK
jgi:hypothetical protein